jgi:NAD(P)-dependent dehydrogenase (short-subunit alcohol dehydrogenase family)
MTSPSVFSEDNCPGLRILLRLYSISKLSPLTLNLQSIMASIPLKEIWADQKLDLPLVATREHVSGGTYIVTGSNTGLGLEAAKHFARLGAAKVIIACRNTRAGETAKVELERETGVRGVTEVWSLDLADYDSVKAFAKRATDTLDRIDALVESAGIAQVSWAVAQGHELSITVNLISTFLLAVLLLPKMSEVAQRFQIAPRIAIVSSETAFMAKAELDKIRDDPIAKADNEKLANVAGRYGMTGFPADSVV